MTLPRITVLFDADCGFCGRTAVLLHRLDRDRLLRFMALQHAPARIADAPSLTTLMERMHVTDDAGVWIAGGQAWLAVLDRLPAGRPISWLLRLPGLRELVDPVYQLIADHRAMLSRWLGAQACRLPEQPSRPS